jgi:hypothetical protein
MVVELGHCHWLWEVPSISLDEGDDRHHVCKSHTVIVQDDRCRVRFIWDNRSNAGSWDNEECIS